MDVRQNYYIHKIKNLNKNMVNYLFFMQCGHKRIRYVNFANRYAHGQLKNCYQDGREIWKIIYFLLVKN